MQLAPRSAISTPKKAAVLHAYGIGESRDLFSIVKKMARKLMNVSTLPGCSIGPAGFQASLGYALEAGDMIGSYFQKTGQKRSSKL